MLAKVFYALTLLSLALSRPVRRERDDIVPEFVKEIYNNVSSRASDYNTVRPFEAVPLDNDIIQYDNECRYQFTFPLSAIKEEEYIKKATLRLHAEGGNNANVNVKAELLGTGEDENPSKYLSNSHVSQFIEFEVAVLVKQAKDLNKLAKLSFQVSLDTNCDGAFQLTVASSLGSENAASSGSENEPLLIVYSYDEQNEIVNTIVKKLDEESLNSRRKRQATSTSSNNQCSHHELHVSNERFNEILADDFEIVWPVNVPLHRCGGSCDDELSTKPNHAALLSLYVSREEDSEQAKYRRCCVPIAYDALTLVINPKDSDQSEIKILPKATATECACVHDYRS